jgi:hypothetical protein
MANAREIRDLFDRVELVVDPLVVDRIIELGASLQEISEAMNVEGTRPVEDPAPSSPRVAEVRAILAELLEEDGLSDGDDSSGTPPARGFVRAGHPPQGQAR